MPAQRTDVDKRRYAKGQPVEVQWHPFFCSSILRPVDTSDAPAGTSLHRLPLHRCPARIAVSASASLSLIKIAGQQGDVGTYRQGASVVFQNERMSAQAQTLIKRRDAKGAVRGGSFWGKAPAGPRRCSGIRSL